MSQRCSDVAKHIAGFLGFVVILRARSALTLQHGSQSRALPLAVFQVIYHRIGEGSLREAPERSGGAQRAWGEAPSTLFSDLSTKWASRVAAAAFTIIIFLHKSPTSNSPYVIHVNLTRVRFACAISLTFTVFPVLRGWYSVLLNIHCHNFARLVFRASKHSLS